MSVWSIASPKIDDIYLEDIWHLIKFWQGIHGRPNLEILKAQVNLSLQIRLMLTTVGGRKKILFKRSANSVVEKIKKTTVELCKCRSCLHVYCVQKGSDL